MSILSRLFGGGRKPEPEVKAEAEHYKGYRITPQPQSGSDGFRVGALIEKDVDGEVKQHHLRRADTLRTLDEALAFSLRKAKQVIDEQGDRIFD